MKSSPGEPNTESFSVIDTNVAKGMAVVLLLFHHLYYMKPEAPPIIFGVSPVYFLATVSKVCVAIFVLLSGYGLSLSYHYEPLGEFWKKRFVRLLTNYWLMWMVFVPIGVLVFDRSLSAVYGDRNWMKTILNILGIQEFFGFAGYNPTWWFMSLIVALYLVFPVLKRVVDAFGFLGVAMFLPFLFLEEGPGPPHLKLAGNP